MGGWMRPASRASRAARRSSRVITPAYFSFSYRGLSLSNAASFVFPVLHRVAFMFRPLYRLLPWRMVSLSLYGSSSSRGNRRRRKRRTWTQSWTSDAARGEANRGGMPDSGPGEDLGWRTTAPEVHEDARARVSTTQHGTARARGGVDVERDCRARGASRFGLGRLVYLLHAQPFPREGSYRDCNSGKDRSDICACPTDRIF